MSGFLRAWISFSTTSEQALSIEQEVEKRLGIQDVPVAGEMRDYWN